MTASDSFKSSVEISVRPSVLRSDPISDWNNNTTTDVTHTPTTQTPTEMVLVLVLMDSREEIAHTPTQPQTKAASSFSSQSALLDEIEWGKKGPFLLILLPTLFATFSSSAKKISPTKLLSSSEKLEFSFFTTPAILPINQRKNGSHSRSAKLTRRSLKRRTIFWL